MTTAGLFRPEAMERLKEPDLGSVLQQPPKWLSACVWFLVIAGIAASLLAACGSFPVYESGVGVLRLGVANAPGTDAQCSIERLSLAGAPATSPESGASRPMYIALLTGNSRPKLVPGMRVLLRVAGYPDAILAAKLDSMGERLIGADEARFFLASLGVDASRIDGPVISICGRLETDRFESGGNEYRLKDGMLASARVKVREQRALDRLVPRAR